MNKILIPIALLILAGGTYYYLTNVRNVQPAGDERSREIMWEISELSEDPAMPGTPRTRVAISYEGERREIGEYNGSCAVIDNTSWTLQPGEKTGVICWWAGGGDEVGVFEENGKMLVKTGTLEEGTAEGGGFRGNYQTVLEL